MNLLHPAACGQDHPALSVSVRDALIGLDLLAFLDQDVDDVAAGDVFA